MAYNSFDEYNTEAAYNDKETTAKKWAELAKAAGYTRQSALDTASPSWKNSKYMKGALDEVFGVDTPTNENNPVVETPIEETPKVQTQDAQKRQAIVNSANELADKGAENAQNDIEEGREKANEMTEKTVNDYIALAKENAPDPLSDNIPTSLFKYYKEGHLGNLNDPATKKDAKIRLGYLIVNNLASGLKQMSNNFAAAAGRSPAFTDTESDWNKIKRTNLEQGLQGHWKKINAMQDEAIQILKDNAATTSEMTQALRLWKQNSKLQNAMAGMTEEQKKNTLLTLAKAGNYINDLSPEDLVGFIEGAIVLNNLDATKALAVLGGKAAGSALNNGVLDTITEATAGISGGNSGNKEILDINGKPFKLSTVATTEEKEKFDKAVKALYEKYKTGQVSKEQFIELYTPYVKAKEGHPSMSYLQPENAIKAMDKGRIDKAKKEIKELNDKKGKISFDAYNEQYDNILKNFEKTGGNPSVLAKEKRITKAWVLRNPSK